MYMKYWQTAINLHKQINDKNKWINFQVKYMEAVEEYANSYEICIALGINKKSTEEERERSEAYEKYALNLEYSLVLEH